MYCSDINNIIKYWIKFLLLELRSSVWKAGKFSLSDRVQRDGPRSLLKNWRCVIRYLVEMLVGWSSGNGMAYHPEGLGSNPSPTPPALQEGSGSLPLNPILQSSGGPHHWCWSFCDGLYKFPPSDKESLKICWLNLTYNLEMLVKNPCRLINHLYI